MTSEQFPVDEGTADENGAHDNRMRRAGYGPDDVCGDTDTVRPQ